MTNGQENNIYGFKFGTDWEVINKLTLSSFIALRLANKEVSNSGTNFFSWVQILINKVKKFFKSHVIDLALLVGSIILTCFLH